MLFRLLPLVLMLQGVGFLVLLLAPVAEACQPSTDNYRDGLWIENVRSTKYDHVVRAHVALYNFTQEPINSTDATIDLSTGRVYQGIMNDSDAAVDVDVLRSRSLLEEDEDEDDYSFRFEFVRDNVTNETFQSASPVVAIINVNEQQQVLLEVPLQVPDLFKLEVNNARGNGQPWTASFISPKLDRIYLLYRICLSCEMAIANNFTLPATGSCLEASEGDPARGCFDLQELVAVVDANSFSTNATDSAAPLLFLRFNAPQEGPGANDWASSTDPPFRSISRHWDDLQVVGMGSTVDSCGENFRYFFYDECSFYGTSDPSFYRDAMPPLPNDIMDDDVDIQSRTYFYPIHGTENVGPFEDVLSGRPARVRSAVNYTIEEKQIRPQGNVGITRSILLNNTDIELVGIGEARSADLVPLQPVGDWSSTNYSMRSMTPSCWVNNEDDGVLGNYTDTASNNSTENVTSSETATNETDGSESNIFQHDNSSNNEVLDSDPLSAGNATGQINAPSSSLSPSPSPSPSPAPVSSSSVHALPVRSHLWLLYVALGMVASLIW